MRYNSDMIPGMRGAYASRYIFFETLPTFIMGLAVFISIILMFQVLRLTEFALIHGVDIRTIAEIIGYVCISMLPALLPMSLLFAVLLTYGRLSADSEIVAMKASGLPMFQLMLPALVLSLLIAIISARTTFEIAPWGNRQFELLYTRLGNTKAAATIKSGTFSEGFFDMVVYANEVDSDKGILKGVFIYDEHGSDTPLTIIARSGQIIPDPAMPGHRVLLRLLDGDIHQKKEQGHTKIQFESYDLRLMDPIREENREKSPPSLTLTDLDHILQKKNLSPSDQRIYQTEYHKRWALAFLCPIFALLGVGLGTQTNRRTQKAGGMVLCILLIIGYWIFHLVFEGMARSGSLPPVAGVWIPNIIFSAFAAYSLKKNWN